MIEFLLSFTISNNLYLLLETIEKIAFQNIAMNEPSENEDEAAGLFLNR